MLSPSAVSIHLALPRQHRHRRLPCLLLHLKTHPIHGGHPTYGAHVSLLGGGGGGGGAGNGARGGSEGGGAIGGGSVGKGADRHSKGVLGGHGMAGIPGRGTATICEKKTIEPNL